MLNRKRECCSRRINRKI